MCHVHRRETYRQDRLPIHLKRRKILLMHQINRILSVVERNLMNPCLGFTELSAGCLLHTYKTLSHRAYKPSCGFLASSCVAGQMKLKAHLLSIVRVPHNGKNQSSNRLLHVENFLGSPENRNCIGFMDLVTSFQLFNRRHISNDYTFAYRV